jgi:acetyl esterase/lipase
MIGEHDNLRDESIDLSKKLKTFGTEVDIKIFKNGFHGFLPFRYDETLQFLKECMNKIFEQNKK